LNILRFLIITRILTVFSNCAVVMHGSNQKIKSTANPENISYTLDDIHKEETPDTIKLKKRAIKQNTKLLK